MTDDQLVKKCLENDALAQKQLYDSFSKKMMGVCLRYAKDVEEAQDVLQMGFIKVFGKLTLYNSEGSLEGWIRKIMVNTALDNIRKNKKFKENIGMDKVDYQLSYADVNGYENLKAEDLLRVIQSLPIGFQTVFNLFAIEGFTHKEIAEELNISINTSKSQYSRARAHLKKLIIENNI